MPLRAECLEYQCILFRCPSCDGNGFNRQTPKVFYEFRRVLPPLPRIEYARLILADDNRRYQNAIIFAK